MKGKRPRYVRYYKKKAKDFAFFFSFIKKRRRTLIQKEKHKLKKSAKVLLKMNKQAQKGYKKKHFKKNVNKRQKWWHNRTDLSNQFKGLHY